MIYHVVKLVENHQHRELDLKPAKVKLLIRALDIRHFPSLIELMEADIKANKKPHDFTVVSTLKAIYQEVLDHNHPVQISDLAINGNDVARFGYRKKKLATYSWNSFIMYLNIPMLIQGTCSLNVFNPIKIDAASVDFPFLLFKTLIQLPNCPWLY